MATFNNPNNPGGLSFNIPNEGETFLGTDPNFLYQRSGMNIYHTQLPPGYNTKGLQNYNFADIASVFPNAGKFINYRPYDANLFKNQPIGGGNLTVPQGELNAPSGVPILQSTGQPAYNPATIPSTATPQQITPEQLNISDITNKVFQDKNTGAYSKIVNGKEIQTDARGNPLPQNQRAQGQPNRVIFNPKTNQWEDVEKPTITLAQAQMGQGTSAPLGSADRTNELLRATGSNQQFTNQANQHAPVTPPNAQNSPVATTGAGTSTPPPPESFEGNVQKILDVFKANGITPATSSVSPMTSVIDTYKQFYQQMGLPTIKEHFDALQKRYGDLQKELQDKIASVNNNPWLSEGLRSKQVAQVQDRYEARTNALTNELKLTESMYDHGRQEAQFWAGKGLELSHQNEVFNEGLVKNAIDIADKQLTAQRALSKEAGIESRFERSQAATERRFQQLHEGGGFTIGQTNKGANSAGLTNEEFRALAPDVQNFYTHLTAPQAKDLGGLLSGVKSGTVNAEEAKRNIDSKTMTPAVKTHLKGLIDKNAPAGGRGWVGNLWEGLKSKLGF